MSTEISKLLLLAAQNDDYDFNTKISHMISVTQLVGSPRVRILGLFNEVPIVTDHGSAIYRILGQSVHSILERTKESNVIKELRLELPLQGTGLILSGKFDRFEILDGRLTDLKVTTKYKSKGSPEWEAQLNVLAFLIREVTGMEVKSLNNHMIFRDWMKQDKFKHDMPESCELELSVPLWNIKRTKDYITERALTHEKALEIYKETGKLIMCTDEERWHRPDVYSVLKADSTRAYRNFATQAEAFEFCTSHPAYRVERRAGSDVKCMEYCNVREICDYGKKLKETAGGQEEL